MFIKILKVLMISANHESVIAEMVGEYRDIVHGLLKQLEMVGYVRQIDKEEDSLWGITYTGRQGMGKPTLDMKIPVNPIVMTHNELTLQVKQREAALKQDDPVAKSHAAFLVQEAISKTVFLKKIDTWKGKKAEEKPASTDGSSPSERSATPRSVKPSVDAKKKKMGKPKT